MTLVKKLPLVEEIQGVSQQTIAARKRNRERSKRKRAEKCTTTKKR